MSKSNLEVIRVMAWCHFYKASSKFHINIIVCNYFKFSTNKWQYDKFTDNILISFILRINSYCSITEHRFRSCCCNNYIILPVYFNILIFKKILNMIKCTILLFITNFSIGNCCMAYWTPVNNFFAFINISFIIKFFKGFKDCMTAAFIHSKSKLAPVTTCTHLLLLINDI